MFHNLFDSHTHSENSPDGTHSVTMLADVAVQKGLQGLAITDHCDCDLYEEQRFEERVYQSYLDATIAREAFQHRLIITRGIELSQFFHDPAVVRRVLGMLEYDFVLGTIHRMMGWEDFYNIDFKDMSSARIADMFRLYFSETMRYIKRGGFDVLGHMTFPVRYLKLHGGVTVDVGDYREEIDAVLRLLVETGTGLELNTSGLRNGLEETLPPAWAITRFAELGGELVSVGSDAHMAGDLAGGLQEGMEMLLKAGLRYFAFYRRRKPVMLRII